MQLDHDASRSERRCFQTARAWSPRCHLDAEVAIVYGIDAGLPERIATWREHGYRIHVMTGVSWGEYQEYLYGRFDGVNHEDEAQQRADGSKWLHHPPDTFYMSPGPTYGEFLWQGVKRAIDAGAEAVHLEEPEFWGNAGWEPSFRRAWQVAYNEPWQAPDSSPEAQWRASQLKSRLYRDALGYIFNRVRAYATSIGRTVPCYVPTHSVINYAQWNIISPEASLLELGCDGYIAQVWTGTARTPTRWRGVRAERSFDSAYLEYGVMAGLARATKGQVWLLNDPIEDNPAYGWDDYRHHWENTLTASLLRTESDRFEIMPWPDRILQEKYPRILSPDNTVRDAPDAKAIPAGYEVELQTVFRAMGEIDCRDEVQWLHTGTAGVGVLVSDTIMFQRQGVGAADSELGGFFGLALPLVKSAIPVLPVQAELLAATGALEDLHLLYLTYEGQKPPDAALHECLAAWVRAGNALVIIDDDADPFQGVRAWWNTGDEHWATPRHHLFDRLGLSLNAHGLLRVGTGAVLYLAQSPSRLGQHPDGHRQVLDAGRQAAEAIGLPWTESRAFALRRGPFVIAAGIDELPNDRSIELHGDFLDLFDPQQSRLRRVVLSPGRRCLLRDLTVGTGIRIAAASARISNWSNGASACRFTHSGIEGSLARVVIQGLDREPTEVTHAGQPLSRTSWSWFDGLLRLELVNTADAHEVVVRLPN